jgi:hypothetical protein
MTPENSEKNLGCLLRPYKRISPGVDAPRKRVRPGQKRRSSGFLECPVYAARDRLRAFCCCLLTERGQLFSLLG